MHHVVNRKRCTRRPMRTAQNTVVILLKKRRRKKKNRKLRAEERKQRRDKIKHIKIRSSQGLKGEESPVPEDDSNKQDDEREISLQGGPAGSRGNLLDLATGAKTGTGSAMTGPLPIAMSEPMKGAWSSLLKAVLGDQRGVVFNPRFRTSESPSQKT